MDLKTIITVMSRERERRGGEEVLSDKGVYEERTIQDGNSRDDDTYARERIEAYRAR